MRHLRVGEKAALQQLAFYGVSAVDAAAFKRVLEDVIPLHSTQPNFFFFIKNRILIALPGIAPYSMGLLVE